MNAIDYFFEYSKNSSQSFIVNKQEEISCSDLYVKVVSLASFINQKFGKKKNILLCSNNNRFFVTSYLAIIKSGNVCVPLNTASSESTVNFIFKETHPVFAFVQKRYGSLIQFAEIEMMNEEEVDSVIRNMKNHEPMDFLVKPDDLAEIIYTSGSTAFPKGVMISHRNLVANTGSIIKYLELTQKDRMLAVLPFHYCYGLSLLHTHLRVGGSLVLNTTFMLLGSVINDLKNYKCTGFAGVPSHFQILLRKSDSFKKNIFESLRYVTQAGGKLHKIFIEEFIESFPDIKFFVMYGQTEATARLSYLPPEKLKNKLGSIGIAIPGVELIVCNTDGLEAQNNETGEIYAKGDNIMSGYYNEPDLTKNTLVNGYLKTGDLGHKDEDGYIYLVARKKEIIKVGGERVSPKEIEEVIVKLPEIIDCTIEAVDDEILGEKIKATIVVGDHADIKVLEEKILNECKIKLSPIKVPQLIEFARQVNVSSSGKKVKGSI
jgi:long-chain acyl-CoA synthetase